MYIARVTGLTEFEFLPEMLGFREVTIDVLCRIALHVYI